MLLITAKITDFNKKQTKESKMSTNSSSSSGGVGVIGLLGIVFVVLKLCGVIAWSWWYVTMPFWGGFAIIAIIAIIAIPVYVVFRNKGK